MSLLNRLFNLCSCRACSADRRQEVVIDARGFLEKRGREANGSPSPRDNFYVLKTLAAFAQREGAEMAAVFVGRPLREAGEGETFKGISVYYAESEKTFPQKIKDVVRRRRASGPVVIMTNDRQIEREAGKMNAQCMRLTTIRKAMEGNFDHDRPPRPIQRKSAPAEPEKSDADERPPANDEKSARNVLDLIDPI
ncbi:MAG: NYN domain-containing protein [Kiritimatiellae bacterium]|nr:NYN domain-containing protein [Kiritimatiellia bacterium]